MSLSQNLAREFQEFALLMQLDGANVFKVNAYTKAIEVLQTQSLDLEAHVKNNSLTSIEGIGKGIAEKITEYCQEGSIAELNDLRTKYPPGLLEMTSIPGFGAKKAKAVFEELGLTTLQELQSACEDGRVAGLKGFGKKTAEKILEGIEQRKKHSGRFRINQAWSAALPLLSFLRELPEVERAEVAGSLRRSKETVKDLDFVCATTNPETVMKAFCNHETVERIIGSGGTKASVVLFSGIGADLRCVSAKQFPFTLQHFTGSKEHNTALRSRAKELGLKSNEYGIFPEGNEQSLEAKTEEDVYKLLKLEWIAPERRENRGEIAQAEKGKQPKLISHSDLRGLLHLHTTYSDGKPTLKEYADWAVENNIQWMGITDHSQAAAYAGGMKPEQVRQQWEAIDSLNSTYADQGIRLMKGVESDILKNGDLDYDSEVLAKFDFLIASVHSQFQLKQEEQTARIIAAIENPYTDILGHPTGRLLLKREGYEVDQLALIQACAAHGVAIEINCNPYRLDLDWRMVEKALEHGVMLCLSPDAHAMDGLGDVCYGLGIARKAGCEAANILNTLSSDEFLKALRRNQTS